MSRSWGLTLLGVVLLAAIAWNTYCENPRIRRETELVVSSDSLDRVLAAWARDSAARAKRQQATEDTVRQLRATEGSARGRGDSAAHVAESLARAIAGRGGMIPAVDAQRALAAKDAALAARGIEILSLEAQLRIRNGQLADSGRELRTQRLALATAVDQRNEWQRLARRDRLRVRFPCAGAFATPQLELRAGVGVCVS